MSEGSPAVWVRAARVYREKGLRGVWFAAAARAGYRRLVALEKRLDGSPVEIPPVAGAEIRELGPGDEDAFAALGQEPAAAFRERLESGHRCWGAWCAGGLGHVQWLGFGAAGVEYLGCRLLLSDEVVYVYRAFTLPQLRGRGLTPATQAACLPEVHRQGCRLALCAVLPENRWAFSPWLKVGYRRVGVIRSVAAGRRRWTRAFPDGGALTAAGWRLAGGAAAP